MEPGIKERVTVGVYLVQEQCLLREAYWSFFNADEMVHSVWMPIQFMCALILPWIAAAVIEKVSSFGALPDLFFFPIRFIGHNTCYTNSK